MRIILDHLYQDLVGPLVQDLCIRILWTACVGILYDHLCKISVCSSTSARSRSGSLHEDPLGHCIRILLDNLCKICVSGSLCENPLDHLYQDPAGALVQDPCCEDTCARSLYQAFWTTCIRVLWDHFCKISV